MFWGGFGACTIAVQVTGKIVTLMGVDSLIAVDKQNKKTNKEISGNLTIKMKFKQDEGDKQIVNREKGTDID